MNVLMSRNGLVPLELCVSARRLPENVILQEKTPNSALKTSAMKIKTPLLTIISVVAVAAAATFTSFDAEKLDANSANSLAATAETFPSFKETMLATASFPLSNAEADATAAAFLPWLFLLRLKRRLAQHLVRKRNHSAPSKRRLKPALLWSTALLMAGILTVTSLANPLGLIFWIERGKKGLGTHFHWGHALHDRKGHSRSRWRQARQHGRGYGGNPQHLRRSPELSISNGSIQHRLTRRSLTETS